MSTACFTKLIEQLQSLRIRHGAVSKKLQLVSALGGGDVITPASSISLTCLWISDPEFCRNWKKEATRGGLGD